MLNDLISIERGLASEGITAGGRHPDVKDMAKGSAFLLRLAADGSLDAVEFVKEAGRGGLWTLRDGQHNGFPGLKTTTGLLHLDADERERHRKVWDAAGKDWEKRAELVRLCSAAPFNPDTASWPGVGHRKRIAERLGLLAGLASDPKAAAVPAAFERFLAAVEQSPSLPEQFLGKLVSSIQDRDDDWLNLSRQALIDAVAVFIDVSDEEFERDVRNPRQVAAVSAALSAAGATAAPSSQTLGVRCALTGEATTLHSGNFPQPTLPSLGQTYLFSRNSDIPSLTRYGRSAGASLPVGADIVRRLAGALSYLTREDARGETWQLIARGTGGAQDLLVVGLPGFPLADALSKTEDEDALTGETKLDELGKKLLAQLRGDGAVQKELPVEILVLRTVDPANRKTVYHRTTTPAGIASAFQKWRQALGNLPEEIAFVLPVKGEKKPAVLPPPKVSPLSLTRVSRQQFVSGGKRRVDVVGVDAAEAFALLLRDGYTTRRAHRLLRLLLERYVVLCSALSHVRAKGGDHLKTFDSKADLRRDALRSIAWIGVLLHTLGRFASRKEDAVSDQDPYPEDLPYLLGQFLSAADYLHAGYCADMRGGDVPPTLIGNSVFAVAGSNPGRAFSILQTRLKPYVAWTRSRDRIDRKLQALRDDKKDIKAQSRVYAMLTGLSHARRAEAAASLIREKLQPYLGGSKRPDDAFRAELLLGYLAGFPRPPKSSPSGAAGDPADDPAEERV